MNYITQISRFTSRGISMVVVAFSLLSFFSINDNINSNTDKTVHTALPSAENDKTEKPSFSDAQESVFVADGDTVVVKSFGTDLSYDITEIRAKAGSTITIRYENTSDMPHNIVFVKTRADIQPVGVAGIRARDTGYVPMSDDMQERIFSYTDLAKPGTTVHVTLTVPDPGTYPYICTYPGHFTMMQGDLVSEE